jgi:hypothetical protein
VTLCDKFVNLEGRREKRRGAWEQIQAPLLLIDQDFVYLRDHLLLESILDISIIKLFMRQPSIRKIPYRQQFSTRVWRLGGHATLSDSSDYYVHEIRQNGVWSCKLKEHLK